MGLMALGKSAMFANYAALQTTGNNIANASTPGYSRQTVELGTAGGQFTGAGFFGKGVDVQTVTRSYDRFLTQQSWSSSATASADQALAHQLSMLEKVFPTGEAGLGYASGQLLNAFVDVAARPQDASARQVVLSRATDLATRFRDAAEQIDTLQRGVTQDVKTMLEQEVNQRTQLIAALNQQIASVRGAGHEPNDLLDQRDQAVAELNKYIRVTSVPADDGTVSLFIGAGQRLVLGALAVPLVAVQDPFDPSRVGVGIKEAGVTQPISDDLITGGEVAGLLRFQRNDLPAARDLLGQMAAAISSAVNDQQARGLDLRTPAQAGSPIFSSVVPRVSSSTNNAKVAGVEVASYVNGAGQRVPTIGMDIVDASQLRASTYELYADPALPAGTYKLTRNSDGTTMDVSAGDVVDGFRITLAGPPASPPQPRDRFLLQPVSDAARNLACVLDDPKGLAAASPVTANVGTYFSAVPASTNTGTLAVASLRTAGAGFDPTSAVRLDWTSATDYSYQVVDQAGNVTGSGSGTWTPGTPISVGGVQVDFSGTPAAGDRVDLRKTLSAVSNVATITVDNHGTMSVGSLRVVDAAAMDPTLTVNLDFTGPGAYRWQFVDTAGNVSASGTGSFTPGQPVTINGVELQLNGVPATGDALTIAKTQFPAANNGNALALAALRDAAIVGRRDLGNGTVAGGDTVTDAYANAMSNIGVRVQSAQSTADFSASAAADAEKQRVAKAGVNLDEEAARLIQFQQSYQAAAKMLQVAQQMFDTLLSMAK